MKSLINNSNSHKVPLAIIIIFIFLYFCPNIRIFSVGENSFFPIFIFLLGFSFFKERELYIYFIYFLTTILITILSAFNEMKFGDFYIISSLQSLYILTVPILSSISLGRILGSRFFYFSSEEFKKEFKLILSFIGILFTSSALLKIYLPSLLYFFLYVRTTYGRFAFFFTEPSQSSSVILILFTLIYFLFRKNKFSEKLSPQNKIFGIITLFSTTLILYLARPLSLIFQIGFFILSYSFLLLIKLLNDLIKRRKINLSLLGMKKSYDQFFKILLSFIGTILLSYFFVSNVFTRLIGIINASSIEEFFINFSKTSGFRFFFSLSSIIEGIKNPVSLPGDWVGQFKPVLYNLIELFEKNFIPIPDPYSLFQLYKNNPLLLKPQGWLYFSIFDLGIIGFTFFAFFILFDYLKYFYHGISRFNNHAIILFSLQIALIIVPLLPSTPSIFFPILIVSAIQQYKKNKFLFSNK